MKLSQIPVKLVIGFYRMLLKSLFFFWPARAVQQAFRLFASPRVYKVRQHEQEILEKASIQTMEFQNHNIVTYHWGKGDKKALLIHGWEGHAGNMGAFVAPLLQQGFEVIAFDGPAHGKSSGKMTNLFQFASLTAYFLKNYNIEIIVAHSFGSTAAIIALHREKISLPHLVMVTTMNRFSEAFEDFSHLMGLSEQEHLKFLTYVENLFGHQVDSLETASLASQTRVKQMTLFHSPSDKLIDIHHAYEMAEKNPDLQLYTPDNLGHYRILWDEGIINTFRKLLSG